MTRESSKIFMIKFNTKGCSPIETLIYANTAEQAEKKLINQYNFAPQLKPIKIHSVLDMAVQQMEMDLS